MKLSFGMIGLKIVDEKIANESRTKKNAISVAILVLTKWRLNADVLEGSTGFIKSKFIRRLKSF